MSERSLDLLYEVAEARGGYFTAQQASDAGISSRLLTYYTRARDIERVAHGVYRLVRFPTHRFGDLIAAALWAGPDSAVSHESALTVYALAGAMPPIIHVTVPRTFRGKRSGVVIHATSLSRPEVTIWEDVPVTTVERTFVDVAFEGDPSLASQAVREAIQRGLTTRNRLSTFVQARPDAKDMRRRLGLIQARPKYSPA